MITDLSTSTVQSYTSKCVARGVTETLIEPAATGFYEGHILVSGGTALHCEVLDRTHNERWLQRSAPVDSWRPGRWHDPAVLRKEDFLRNVRLL